MLRFTTDQYNSDRLFYFRAMFGITEIPLETISYKTHPGGYYFNKRKYAFPCSNCEILLCESVGDQ